jgi:two-component system, cell cycle response regulator
MTAAPAPHVHFRTLASSLVRRTLAVAILCTLVAATIQALFVVSEERAAFDRALRNIADTHVPLLSVAVWDIEPEAIRRQLQRIASEPEIAYVRLSERTGHVFEAGDARLRDPKDANTLAVPYPAGQPGTIGTLEVTANRQILFRHLAEKVLAVVLGYGLLSLVLCALIAMVLRTELEKPLRHLARFTSELSPENLTRPLDLSRPLRPWRDEIDLVAAGFRTLQDGIHAHVANLDGLVASRTAQLEVALEEIRELTITDSLTGCFNRRHLDLKLAEEVLRSHRASHPLGLLVCDLDHFKRVNDTLGHPAGDEVLRCAAAGLRREVRERIDWVARFGGEEFVVVLPNTTAVDAMLIAERMRRAIEEGICDYGGREIRITASFGAAQCRIDDDGASLLARADAMLYRAKAAGRNRVVEAPGEIATPEGARSGKMSNKPSQGPDAKSA